MEKQKCKLNNNNNKTAPSNVLANNAVFPIDIVEGGYFNSLSL